MVQCWYDCYRLYNVSGAGLGGEFWCEVEFPSPAGGVRSNAVLVTGQVLLCCDLFSTLLCKAELVRRVASITLTGGLLGLVGCVVVTWVCWGRNSRRLQVYLCN